MLVAVSLYFWGDKLDPKHLTELLGVEPSISRAKGETETTSTNKVVTAKIGVWGFSTDTELKDVSLANHIELLRSRLGESWTKVHALPDVEDACVDVFVAIEALKDGTEAGFELSPQNLAGLQQLGLPIRFTVAFTDTNGTRSGGEELG
jgi:hypothetical protein